MTISQMNAPHTHKMKTEKVLSCHLQELEITHSMYKITIHGYTFEGSTIFFL